MDGSRALACSEIRRVRRRSRGVRAQEERILCADRFWPVADEAPIGHLSRPGRGENAWVLNCELDLQPLLACVRINGAAPVGRTGPVYGSVLYDCAADRAMGAHILAAGELRAGRRRGPCFRPAQSCKRQCAQRRETAGDETRTAQEAAAVETAVRLVL
jgi:hypothetical protein